MRSLQCETCGAEFSGRAALDNHWQDFPDCKPDDAEATNSERCTPSSSTPGAMNTGPHGNSSRIVAATPQSGEDKLSILLSGPSLQKRVHCSICNQSFTDVDTHIQHMKDKHNMRHNFRCSGCKKCFSSKEEIEAHLLRDHGQKVSLNTTNLTPQVRPTSQKPPTPQPESTTRAQQPVSLKIAQRTSPSKVGVIISDGSRDRASQSRASTSSQLHGNLNHQQAMVATVTSTSSYDDAASPEDDQDISMIDPNLSDSNSQSTEGSEKALSNSRSTLKLVANNGSPYYKLDSLKKEHLRLYQGNNLTCHMCDKLFESELAFINHFSRRIPCREYYIIQVGKKLQEEGLTENVGQEEEENNQERSFGSMANSKHSNEEDSNSSLRLAGPRRITSQALGVMRPGQRHRTTNENSQSQRTSRGSEVGGLMNVTPNSAKRVSESPSRSGMEDSQARYWCKMCGRKDELKTRTALGTHLTIFHQLPAVNVPGSEGQLRCQTCKMVFTSKHYYNSHRPSCDANSPYIGVEYPATSSRISPQRSPPKAPAIRPAASLNIPSATSSNLSETESRSKPISSAQSVSNRNSQRGASNNANKLACDRCNKICASENHIALHQKYLCARRDAPSSSYGAVPAQIVNRAKTHVKRLSTNLQRAPITPLGNVPAHLQRAQEMARLQALQRNSSSSRLTGNFQTHCPDCGQGPYNPKYLLEHKRSSCLGYRDEAPDEPQEILDDDAASSPFSDIAPDVNESGPSREFPPQKPPPLQSFIPGMPRRAGKSTRDRNPVAAPLNSFASRLSSEAPPLLQRNFERFRPNIIDPKDEETQQGRFDEDGLMPKARKSFKTPANEFSHSAIPSSGDQSMSSRDEEFMVIDDIITCSSCNKTFRDAIEFIDHKVQNHILGSHENFTCELCGCDQLFSLQRIQQHLLLHRQQAHIIKFKKIMDIRTRPKPRSEDKDEDASDSTLLLCPYCQAECRNRIDLATHMKNSCPWRFRCQKCHRTYSTKESYLQHREECKRSLLRSQIKRKLYKCLDCNLDFKTKQNLLWHTDSCHKANTIEDKIARVLTCNVCGMSLNTYQDKIRHESDCFRVYMAHAHLNFAKDGEDYASLSAKRNELLARNDLFVHLPNIDGDDLEGVESEPEIDPELVERLRKEHNITQEAKVKLVPMSEEERETLRTRLYQDEAEMGDEEKVENLKKIVNEVLEKLLDKDMIDGLDQDGSKDAYERLIRLLETANQEFYCVEKGIPEYECLRFNVHKFLRMALEDSELKMLFDDTRSLEEALLILLHKPEDESEVEINRPSSLAASRSKRTPAPKRDRFSLDDSLSHTSTGSQSSRTTITVSDVSGSKRKTRRT